MGSELSYIDVSDAEEHIDSTKVAPTDTTYLVAWKKIDSRAMLVIPHSPLPFREEDRITDVDGFGKSIPEQE